VSWSNPFPFRKRAMTQQSSNVPDHPLELDIATRATLVYSSEDPAHPVEHVIDGRCGPGATCWASGRPDTTEWIALEFDNPERISCLIYEVEERQRERTQEVRIAVSSDHGRTQRQIIAQDFNFSPQGATFQHEELRLELQEITHLTLTIVPNKNGSGVATLTCLRIFA
jgi:hypothetical protein